MESKAKIAKMKVAVERQSLVWVAVGAEMCKKESSLTECKDRKRDQHSNRVARSLSILIQAGLGKTHPQHDNSTPQTRARGHRAFRVHRRRVPSAGRNHRNRLALLQDRASGEEFSPLPSVIR